MVTRVLAAFLLVLSPGLLTIAAAQQHDPRAGKPAGPAPRAAAPAAPRPAPAPAPRIAAPPQMSAPRMAPPHVAAPPRFSAPARIAPQQHQAPRPAPHFAAPRGPSPRVSAPLDRNARQIAQPGNRGQIREQRAQRRHDGGQRAERRQDRMQNRVQQNGQQPPSVQAGRVDGNARRQFQAQERQQVRDLRAQQRQRRQELRAQGRRLDRADMRRLQAQERRQLRDLQAQQRQQRRQGIQSQQAQGQQLLRRNGQPRVTADAARRGRFAGRFANRDDRAQWRAGHMAARHAWRRGHRAAFVAWLGPVFWPYAYTDIFYYPFWPDAYDDGYWAYAYDDFFDSVFWGYGGSYANYASVEPYGDEPGPPARRSRGSRSDGTRRDAVTEDVCEPAQGITAWPFEQIQSAVQPNDQQQALLDELKGAAKKAAEAFKASCAKTFSLTPPGRLQAMINRVQAALEALRIVRPPLEAFYASLDDEQKAHFNAIGPDVAKNARAARRAPQEQQANACGDPKPGLTTLPIERIEDVVRPTEAQLALFDRLSEATAKAVQALQAACPDSVPQTPVGRIEAMEKRLDAMLQAAKTVQPALQEFYSSLSNEQKARFNTLGKEAQRE